MRTRYLVVAIAVAFVGVLIVSTRANGEEDPVRQEMLARLFNLDRSEERQEFYRQIFRFDPPALEILGAAEEVPGAATPAPGPGDPTPAVDESEEQVEQREDPDPRIPPASRESARWRMEGSALLREAADVLAYASYKTVYELSGSDPGLGALHGTVTLARELSNRYLDVSGNLGGSEGSFIAIQRPDANFLCIKGQGDSACLKTGAHAASPLPLPAVLELQSLIDGIADQPDASVREIEPREVAGREARCFEVGARPGNGTVCVDVELPMVVHVDGSFRGSNFAVTLKEYQPVPEAGTFEPPFPVAEIP